VSRVSATEHDLGVTARPALEFVAVDLVEHGTTVLRQVTWTVFADERWVVLGPNGSGKTSLLRLAAFQRAPSSGTVTVLGDTYGAVDVRVARRRVGLASSATLQRLRATLTAHDAVVTGHDGALEPWWSSYGDAVHRRADAFLASVGCADHTDQELATLSEGERKRVLVARLLMAEPGLLLFDEPCAGLDLGGREAIVALVGRLARDGPTPLVLVTHHVEEIPHGITHALLVRAGEIVSAGPIATTLTSQAVSNTFGVPVEVSTDGHRYTARIAAEGGFLT